MGRTKARVSLFGDNSSLFHNLQHPKCQASVSYGEVTKVYHMEALSLTKEFNSMVHK